MTCHIPTWSHKNNKRDIGNRHATPRRNLRCGRSADQDAALPNASIKAITSDTCGWHSEAIPLLAHHGTGAIIASCFEQLTQYGSANEWYQRQRRETPDELTTLCLAARFFATCPEDSYRDDTKALELADRAVELSNDTNRWKAIWARTVALGRGHDNFPIRV